MKIALVDYGVGNIFSVGQALKSLNFDYVLDSDGKAIHTADLVLVPGVAAFGAGMKNLEDRGQAHELREFYKTGKPLIGLCLGAQMFLNSSSESTATQGLCFVGGEVVSLNEEVCRVPQQGWSKLIVQEGQTFSEFAEQYFYYSHSFKMLPNVSQSHISQSKHDREVVTAIFVDKNVLGVQFHPERSGAIGLKFLKKAIQSANIWA